MIRRYGFFYIVAMLFMFCAAGVSTAAVVDKVIVVVNDEVVTQREFDRAFIPVKESYEANLEGEELKQRLEEVRKIFLEQLIDFKLVISLAKKEKIEIEETMLQEQIDRIRAYYGSEDAFLQTLNDKGTNLTEFKKEIEEQMLAQEIVKKEVASKIAITPSEINDLYEENKEKLVSPYMVKAREIMVRKNESNPKESGKKIRSIYAKINTGADFSELAKEYSEGPYAANGGDMGYIARGQLLEEMDDAIFTAEKGKNTDIVETKVGYHIFIIDDIKEPRRLELEEVSDFLGDQLFRKKRDESLLKWLAEKRKNAYIAYK